MAAKREILTACARQHPIEPALGMLMKAQAGRRVFRIVGVMKVTRAGDPRGHRYRLTYEKAGEVPACTAVHPWFFAAAPGPDDRRDVLEHPTMSRVPRLDTLIRGLCLRPTFAPYLWQ